MFNLLPRDTVFFDLFDELADHVVAAAEQLSDLARKFPEISHQIQKVEAIETAADDLAHKALDRLDRTFITPLDREDIHALIAGLGDIVDGIDFLAKRFALYHITFVEMDFQKQIDLLVRSAKTVNSAVHRLRKSRKLSDFSPELKAIGQLEKEGDDNNHAAVSRLFTKGEMTPIDVMKWKELYDRIESAIDGCKDVGNTVERIVLKNG